jgi:hypothetical protein
MRDQTHEQRKIIGCALVFIRVHSWQILFFRACVVFQHSELVKIKSRPLTSSFQRPK